MESFPTRQEREGIIRTNPANSLFTLSSAVFLHLTEFVVAPIPGTFWIDSSAPNNFRPLPQPKLERFHPFVEMRFDHDLSRRQPYACEDFLSGQPGRILAAVLFWDGVLKKRC